MRLITVLTAEEFNRALADYCLKRRNMKYHGAADVRVMMISDASEQLEQVRVEIVTLVESQPSQ